MGTSNQNDKTEYDGLKIRPVFPQHRTDWSRAIKIGKTDEERLEELYSKLADWFSEIKVLEKRGRIELEPYLTKALAKARKDGRVRDCSDETALRLGATHTGPDLLLFFVRKCPHCRDVFLRGELPSYPWRTPQVVKPVEARSNAENPAETEQDTTPGKRGSIGALFWTLYEKTVKAFFDAFLNHFWPK